jgi:hypothetical protein
MSLVNPRLWAQALLCGGIFRSSQDAPTDLLAGHVPAPPDEISEDQGSMDRCALQVSGTRKEMVAQRGNSAAHNYITSLTICNFR